MKLIVAPNFMLEAPVHKFNYESLHPAPIALDMIELMNKESGLGLSANQVGLNAQIFVMKAILDKTYGDTLVVINPVIKGLSEETETSVEGCLSHPGLYLKVKRPISCIIEFDTLTTDFKDVIHIEAKLNDIDARIFLHEYDHLHGIQFMDRVSKLKLEMAEKKRFKQQRKING
jgi:N-formylmethionyl-tRNA deformylase